jgi:hypothetical protein
MKKTSLENSARGQWVVRTSSSLYRLDLDRRIGTRSPVTGEAVQLRKDDESWDLVELVSCVVGRPMILMLSGLASGGRTTMRTTTAVLTVERV